MHQNPFKLNHPYQDVPEDVLNAFILLRDLVDSQEGFDNELFSILDERISEFFYFEDPSPDGLLDLTSMIDQYKIEISNIT